MDVNQVNTATLEWAHENTMKFLKIAAFCIFQVYDRELCQQLYMYFVL
jgi:hypothetical protein